MVRITLNRSLKRVPGGIFHIGGLASEGVWIVCYLRYTVWSSVRTYYSSVWVHGQTLYLHNEPDIALITIFSEYYINEYKNLTQEQIANIMFLEVLSHLKHEFRFWHDNLSHLHPKSMFRLAKLGALLAQFLYLKDDMPLWASWILGTERRRPWIKKGKKSVSIWKYTENKLGSAVSVNQLHSSQLWLVPKFSVKLTSMWIWSSQAMVDHLSDLTYVQLIRRTGKE